MMLATAIVMVLLLLVPYIPNTTPAWRMLAGVLRSTALMIALPFWWALGLLFAHAVIDANVRHRARPAPAQARMGEPGGMH
jgi:hypothetical protein